MKVEIIRCANCRAQDADGKAYAVAAAMLTGIPEVESQYVGFDAKRLPSVLRAIIRDLRKDHPGIGRVRIPPTLGDSPWDFSATGRVLDQMKTFLAGVECDDYKIIAFDGGIDDAEGNGYCAIKWQAVSTRANTSTPMDCTRRLSRRDARIAHLMSGAARGARARSASFRLVGVLWLPPVESFHERAVLRQILTMPGYFQHSQPRIPVVHLFGDLPRPFRTVRPELGTAKRHRPSFTLTA
jgi:hypothetical protein